jgi:hypothetical protein
MQSRGHEIGWHNDVVSQYYRGKTDVKDEIQKPLTRLREMGLNIIGTAAHGSPECLTLKMLNYYVWKESKEIYGYPNNFKEQYSLSEFGLEYESYLCEHDNYFTDSKKNFFGGWDYGCIIKRLSNAIEKKQRVILLIHHQLWQI